MNQLNKFVIDNISEIKRLRLVSDFKTQDKGNTGLNGNIPYVTERNFDDILKYYGNKHAFEIKEDTIINCDGQEMFLPKGYFVISAKSTFLGVVDADTFKRLFIMEDMSHINSIEDLKNSGLDFESELLEAYKINGFNGIKKLCETYKIDEYNLNKIFNFIDLQINNEDLFDVFFRCNNYIYKTMKFQKIEEKLGEENFLKINDILLQAIEDTKGDGSWLKGQFLEITYYDMQKTEMLLKALKTGYLSKENIGTIFDLLSNPYCEHLSDKDGMLEKQFRLLDYCIENNVSENKMKIGSCFVKRSEDKCFYMKNKNMWSSCLSLAIFEKLNNSIDNIGYEECKRACWLANSVAYDIKDDQDALLFLVVIDKIASGKLNKLNQKEIENIFSKSKNALNHLPNEKFYVDYIVNFFMDQELAKHSETLDDLLIQNNYKEIDINVNTILELLNHASSNSKAYAGWNKEFDICDFIDVFCEKESEDIKKSDIQGNGSLDKKMYVNNDSGTINIYIKEQGIFGKYTKYKVNENKLEKLKLNEIYINCFYKNEHEKSIDKGID